MTVNNFEFQFQVEWPYHHTMLKLLFFTQCTWPDCLLPYSSSIQGFTLSFSTSVLVIFYLLSNVSFPFFISKRIILPSFWHKYIFLFLLGQIENFINLHIQIKSHQCSASSNFLISFANNISLGGGRREGGRNQATFSKHTSNKFASLMLKILPEMELNISDFF